ncbi:hypothetical protein PO124_25010 [Bacillus licheniformis]|nr:hypothetical protein [Bacillus licheniformis]
MTQFSAKPVRLSLPFMFGYDHPRLYLGNLHPNTSSVPSVCGLCRLDLLRYLCRDLNIRRSQANRRIGKRKNRSPQPRFRPHICYLTLLFTGIPEHPGSWVDFIGMVMLFAFLHF